jgi:hypothetical protein
MIVGFTTTYATGTEMHSLEIAAYNGAMLSNMKTDDVSYVDLFSDC